jgi:hypothetical protein
VKMTRPKYFTPNEVAIHNTVDDLWVSFLGKVYNLTPLCEKYQGLSFLVCLAVYWFGKIIKCNNIRSMNMFKVFNTMHFINDSYIIG